MAVEHLKVTGSRLHHLYVANHRPTLDLRICWEMEYASPDDAFIALGLDTHHASLSASTRQLARNAVEIVGPRARLVSFPDPVRNRLERNAMDALGVMDHLGLVAATPTPQLSRRYDIGTRDADTLKSLCRHFILSNRIILSLAQQLPKPDTIIAADLDSLLPGIFAKHLFDVPLIYDAHEIFCEASDFPPQIVEFWAGVEQALFRHIDHGFGASAAGCVQLERLFEFPFTSLNNAEPFIDAGEHAPVRGRGNSEGPAVFLFIGGISRRRGLHLLAAAWHHVRSDAVLHIQGPIIDNEYWAKVVQEAGSLMGTRIKYLDPVHPDRIRAACQSADVGLISYEPLGPNNTYCCPNKLSHYLSSGLPIIANKLQFVGELISQGRCGVTVDFSNAAALAATIDEFAVDIGKRRVLAENAASYFRDVFNWQKQSEAFYKTLAAVPGTMRDILVPAELNLKEDPTAAFQSMIEQHGLQPVAPCMINGQPDRVWDASTSRVRDCELLFERSGGMDTMTVEFPFVTDAHSLYLKFSGDHLPAKVYVEACAEANSTGRMAFDVNQSELFIPLPGNPASHLIIVVDVSEGTPVTSLDTLIVLTSLQGMSLRSVHEVPASLETPAVKQIGSARAIYNEMVDRYRFQKIEPCLLNGKLDRHWDAATTQVVFNPATLTRVQGGIQRLTVELPYKTAINGLFLRFLGDHFPSHVRVEAFSSYSSTGEVVAIVEDGEAYARLPGNPGSKVVISVHDWDGETPVVGELVLLSTTQGFGPKHRRE